MLAIYPLPFFTNHNTISLSFGGHGSCRQACCSRRERVSIRPLFPSPPNQCTRAENLCDEAPEDSRIPTTRIQRKLLGKRRQLVADNLTLNYLSLCVLFNTVCKQVQFLPGATNSSDWESTPRRALSLRKVTCQSRDSMWVMAEGSRCSCLCCVWHQVGFHTLENYHCGGSWAVNNGKVCTIFVVNVRSLYLYWLEWKKCECVCELPKRWCPLPFKFKPFVQISIYALYANRVSFRGRPTLRKSLYFQLTLVFFCKTRYHHWC